MWCLLHNAMIWAPFFLQKRITHAHDTVPAVKLVSWANWHARRFCQICHPFLSQQSLTFPTRRQRHRPESQVGTLVYSPLTSCRKSNLISHSLLPHRPLRSHLWVAMRHSFVAQSQQRYQLRSRTTNFLIHHALSNVFFADVSQKLSEGVPF